MTFMLQTKAFLEFWTITVKDEILKKRKPQIQLSTTNLIKLKNIEKKINHDLVALYEL